MDGEPGGLQSMRHVPESDTIERLTPSLHLYTGGLADFLNMSTSPALDQPLSSVSACCTKQIPGLTGLTLGRVAALKLID